jgi:hypothetical protein
VHRVHDTFFTYYIYFTYFTYFFFQGIPIVRHRHPTAVFKSLLLSRSKLVRNSSCGVSVRVKEARKEWHPPKKVLNSANVEGRDRRGLRVVQLPNSIGLHGARLGGRRAAAGPRRPGRPARAGAAGPPSANRDTIIRDYTKRIIAHNDRIMRDSSYVRLYYDYTRSCLRLYVRHLDSCRPTMS